MTFREDTEFLARAKTENPALMSAVFGSHPTFMPRYSLVPESVDFIIRHEPEYILRDLAAALERKDDSWKGVKGMGYRVSRQSAVGSRQSRDKESSNFNLQSSIVEHEDQGPDTGNREPETGEFDYVINEDYPFIEDLDELPFPEVDLLPKDIHYFNPIVKRLPYITASTSRGCPARCRFCTAPAFDGKRLRFQSADYVIEQLEYFMSKGFREVYYRDDTFFVNKKRDLAVCEKILEKNLDITWLANARIGMIDKETMALAKKAGCHTIKFGVESGVQEILDKSAPG